MTTPIDWKATIPAIDNLESVKLVKRVVQFHREWLDFQVAYFDDVLRLLDVQEKKIRQTTGPRVRVQARKTKGP